MKLIYPFILFFFMLLIAPSSAFSDNFNDGSITDWEIKGSWIVQSTAPNYDGTNYVQSNSINPWMNYSVGTPLYWEWDAWVSSTTNSPSVDFYIFKDGSTERGFRLLANNFLSINIAGYTTVNGLSTAAWYRITVLESGSNLVVSLYNSGGTLVNQQTIAKPSYTQKSYINITNINVVAPTTYYSRLDNVIVSASSGDADTIYTNLNTYTVDSNVQVNWHISDSNWQWYNTFDIKVVKNGVEVDTIPAGSQTGVYFYTPSDIGSYELNLRKYYLGIFSSTLDSADFSVTAKGQSAIIINPSIPVGKNFNISYVYGQTPDCGSNLCIIKALHQNADLTYTYEKSFAAYGTLAGTMYTTRGNVDNSGTYVFQLWYGGTMLDSKTATANYIYTPIETNLSASFLNISTNSYAMGQIMTGSWGVDNTNYTNYTSYLQFYNWNNSATTSDVFCNPQSAYGLTYPCGQTGSFSISLSNTFYGSTMYGGQLGSLFLIPGLNSIRLMGRNDSTSFILAYQNFTLSAMDDQGYGLIPSANSVCFGSPVTYQIITPGPARFIVTDGLTESLNYSVNKSITLTYVPNNQWGASWQTSNQIAELWDSNGYLHASLNLLVTNCGPGVTPQPTVSGQSAINFISSTSFLAILIFFAIVGICAALGGPIGVVVGVLASIPVMYLAELIPLWVVFLDAGIVFLGIAVMVASAFTKVGK